MTRSRLALLGALVMAQAVWAGAAAADVGRYQLIPDALVPGKGGKLQERTVLLDTTSGLTWMIAPGGADAKSAKPRWVPLEMEGFEPVEAAGDSGRNTIQRSYASPRPVTRGGQPFNWHYDTDP